MFYKVVPWQDSENGGPRMLSRKGQEMPHLLSFCQLNSPYVKLSINFNVSRVPEFQSSRESVTDVSITLESPFWFPPMDSNMASTNTQFYKFGWKIFPNNTDYIWNPHRLKPRQGSLYINHKPYHVRSHSWLNHQWLRNTFLFNCNVPEHTNGWCWSFNKLRLVM